MYLFIISRTFVLKFVYSGSKHVHLRCGKLLKAPPSASVAGMLDNQCYSTAAKCCSFLQSWIIKPNQVHQLRKGSGACIQCFKSKWLRQILLKTFFKQLVTISAWICQRGWRVLGFTHAYKVTGHFSYYMLYFCNQRFFVLIWVFRHSWSGFMSKISLAAL